MRERVFNVGYYCSVVDTMETDAEAIRTKVRERYSIAATGRGSCQNDGCCASGYSPAELARIPTESVLGLGSGNPVRHARLRRGETVVTVGGCGAIERDGGRVGSARVRAEHLETVRAAGFVELRIVEDRAWRTGPIGIDASEVTLISRKPDPGVST